VVSPLSLVLVFAGIVILLSLFPVLVTFLILRYVGFYVLRRKNERAARKFSMPVAASVDRTDVLPTPTLCIIVLRVEPFCNYERGELLMQFSTLFVKLTLVLDIKIADS
jgi:hypothetical protein